MIINWLDPQKQILMEIKDENYAEEDTILNITACLLMSPCDGAGGSIMDYKIIKEAIEKRWGADGLKKILDNIWTNIFPED